jgi:isoquinoline 1-oxidoreductase alpha subunit
MAVFTLTVNGKNQKVDADPDTPVLWILRDQLNLTGTKYGCGIAQCGVCTIHMDGAAVRSCMTPVSSVANRKIVTIEGLAPKADHPLQKAWREHDVPQCGYCQPGQIMSAAALLAKNPDPSEEDIDNAMYGNLCRCATYLKIRKAIKSAAEKM